MPTRCPLRRLNPNPSTLRDQTSSTMTMRASNKAQPKNAMTMHSRKTKGGKPQAYRPRGKRV
jgi:hypothetical protein